MERQLEIGTVFLAQLQEAYPDIDERLLANPELQSTLAHVSRASDFLSRFLFADPCAIEVLSNLEHRQILHTDADTEALISWKRCELLRIAARDLTNIDTMETVGTNLAMLAQDVLTHALHIAGLQDELLVVGMGKLGGNELNYASDVDILFAGDVDPARARPVLEIARQCFRIDTALRPEGRDGPLVRSIDSYIRYWDQWAQTWEFQALLKARAIAGPSAIAVLWAAAAEDTLWKHQFGADELHELRSMKARVESELQARDLHQREVKRGRGGIRDIEFSVQLLQLVHGGVDGSIRSRTTLTALQQLAEGGYIDKQDANSLGDSYRFLRNVEHRLQLVEEEQTHTIPKDTTARKRLARSMGFSDSRNATALAQFDQTLQEHQTRVRTAHERLYFRPLLEAFAEHSTDSNSVIETRLAAFGFTDAQRTRQAVAELTRGLARSSRLMQQLMPLLMDWLSASPDPDEGLLGLRTLIAGFRTPSEVVSLFRDSPEAARRLCLLLGTSRMFSQGFARNPELLAMLGDDNDLVPKTSIIERARHAVAWHKDFAQRQDGLRHFDRAERLRIASADALEMITPTEGGIWRSSLAEAALQVALEDIGSDIPVAVIGMGRFGGDEMSYASDLDVMVVYDGDGPEAQAKAEVVAQRLLESVGSSAPNKQLYPLDYDLRPEGKKGLLARSLNSCASYYNNWAETWERQALVRARFAAGDAATGAAFLDVIRPFVWEHQLTSEELRTIRHLKARMERERLPRWHDPQFNLKLGSGSLSDVEWTVQLLQLQHHVEGFNTLRSLQRLLDQNIIEASDADILLAAWQFCDRVRNRLFLIQSGPGDSLPSNSGRLAVLARSLDMSPDELRERYLQVTRRARSVMERLFYGQAG